MLRLNLTQKLRIQVKLVNFQSTVTCEAVNQHAGYMQVYVVHMLTKVQIRSCENTYNPQLRPMHAHTDTQTHTQSDLTNHAVISHL